MNFAKFILLVVLTVLIIMLGMPNIEQSRQEARNTHAFNLAQQIKAGELPRDTLDPWGNQFDVQRTPPGQVVVSSGGANMATPATGYDSDDISSAMLKPPHVRAVNRKRIQIMATFALAASPWLVALAMLRRGRVARPPQPSDHANVGLNSPHT